MPALCLKHLLGALRKCRHCRHAGPAPVRAWRTMPMQAQQESMPVRHPVLALPCALPRMLRNHLPLFFFLCIDKNMPEHARTITCEDGSVQAASAPELASRCASSQPQSRAPHTRQPPRANERLPSALTCAVPGALHLQCYAVASVDLRAWPRCLPGRPCRCKHSRHAC